MRRGAASLTKLRAKFRNTVAPISAICFLSNYEASEQWVSYDLNGGIDSNYYYFSPAVPVCPIDLVKTAARRSAA